MKTTRQGAVGALLDIYEQATSDFKKLIVDIPETALTTITDPYTTDEDCRSIQAILSHVVYAGFGYASNIYNLKGHATRRPDKAFHETITEYIYDLTNIFSFTETILKEVKEDELIQTDDSLKMKTGWGQSYDIEQMIEHAIIHMMRHQRQIEKVKSNLLK